MVILWKWTFDLISYFSKHPRIIFANVQLSGSRIIYTASGWCFQFCCYCKWLSWNSRIYAAGHSCKRNAKGSFYLGRTNKTSSDRDCQNWNLYSSFHNWTWQYPDDAIDDASNFCRNPDHKPLGPWCYFGDKSDEWEYCDVPLCSGNVFCVITLPSLEVCRYMFLRRPTYVVVV